MAMGKATYSYKNVTDCIEKIEKLNCTVKTKGDHFPALREIKSVYNFCYDKTGCMLFDADFSPCYEYSQLINKDKVTKKKLDQALKNCILDLERQITGIRDAMERGQVNTIQ